MQFHARSFWITFSIIGLVMIFVIIRSLKYGYSLTGKPTIPPLFFYTAKLFFFLNWMLFLIKSIFPIFGHILVPVELSWAGTFLLIIGGILFIPAVLQLGNSLAVWHSGGRHKTQNRRNLPAQPNPYTWNVQHLYRFMPLFSRHSECGILHLYHIFSSQGHQRRRRIPCKPFW